MIQRALAPTIAPMETITKSRTMEFSCFESELSAGPPPGGYGELHRRHLFYHRDTGQHRGSDRGATRASRIACRWSWSARTEETSGRYMSSALLYWNDGDSGTRGIAFVPVCPPPFAKNGDGVPAEYAAMLPLFRAKPKFIECSAKQEDNQLRFAYPNFSFR